MRDEKWESSRRRRIPSGSSATAVVQAGMRAICTEKQ